MPLKLMYITNRVSVAKIAQKYGVDRIFVDMEYIGKNERQGGMDSVKNLHTVEDAANIKKILSDSQLLVRVNPIHEATKQYCDSEQEIKSVLSAGADIIMLPMAKTPQDLERFVKAVNGKARTMFLLETAEACDNIDDFLKVDGIDEIHIGLNDLHLAKNKKFMFELLIDGTVERLCEKIKKANKPFGFGGIARLGYGMLPAENVIAEHYRLGSGMAILSRSFCNADKISDENEIEKTFAVELKKIREYESEIKTRSQEWFDLLHAQTKQKIENIVKTL